MGNIDRDVIKAAPSWAEGLNNYQRQKHQHLFEGETPKPFYVTRHFKSREEAAVNPITQKFNDHDIEHTLKTMEQTGLNRSLNRAWDKQLLREQHFDVITQQPKKGHVHEVPYVQRLKPPSLVTANHVAYNILSGKGLDEHHWAAPGKRPDRIPTPPRKEPFVTAVNKPREVNLLNGRYIDHHEERTKWEMDRNREAVVDKFWETHDFNPVSCSYYDQEKELYYQKRIKEMLLSQGSNAISKLPPTLAASESLMYDICTGVVKDPVRLRQKIEAVRIALENRASKIGAEERMRLGGDVRQDIAAERQLARVSHNRYLDVTARGFHIITNSEFDKDGLPPPAQTKLRPSLWEFKQILADDKKPSDRPRSNVQQNSMQRQLSRMGSAQSQRSQSAAGSAPVSQAGSRQPTSMSGARIRTGAFNQSAKDS